MVYLSEYIRLAAINIGSESVHVFFTLNWYKEPRHSSSIFMGTYFLRFAHHLTLPFGFSTLDNLSCSSLEHLSSDRFNL